MTKVLQVYRDHFDDLPGGIERHVSQLAQGLSSRFAMEVLVSAGRPRSSVVTSGAMTVYKVREFGRIHGVPISPGFIRIMRDPSYDVIHLHSPNPTGEMAGLIARPRGALVATYHADIDRGSRYFGIYRRLLDRIYARCERIIASSERLVESSPVLSRIAETRAGIVEVVPMGVDLARFTPDTTPATLKLRDSWGPLPIVLFLGRLRYYKGLDLLVQAMTSIDARLVIAGDGPERGSVIQLAEETLGERFTYISDVDEMSLPDLYRAADVFCLPSVSHAETFGISAVEAMASGKPIITTEVGTGTTVVNSHDVTGYVIAPRDVTALSSAIGSLIADQGLRVKMGDASRKRAEELFDQRKMFDEIARIYSEVS